MGSYLALGLVGALLIWLIEGKGGPFAFTDILFASVSASTLTGLTVIDMIQLRPGSRAVITLLMFFGSPILWSLLPVLIRRFYFRRSMESHLQHLGLPVEERKRLLNNEIEYRALGWILRIALFHFLFWPLLVMIAIGGYLSASSPYESLSAVPVDQAQASAMVLDRQGVSIWWFAFFSSYSSFLNAGLSLVIGSLTSFVSDYPILLLNAMLIILGNTAFPVLMRLSVLTLRRIYKDKEQAFAFLLTRPRKCYTLLYHGQATLVLAGVLLVTLFGELFMFFALDWDNAYLDSFPPTVRSLAGFFQSTSTRTAGYNVIDLARVGECCKALA
jgi:Trk-type K+ transport system membrane component